VVLLLKIEVHKAVLERGGSVDPTQRGDLNQSLFKADAGICYHIPPNLGEVADYYRRFIDPIDIVVLKVRPADASGYFNFGPTNGWTWSFH